MSRLEEIKQYLVLLHNATDVDEETKDYIFGDLKVEWLIQQAERVEELERHGANLAYELTKRKIAIDIKEQRLNRYKQALEEIANAGENVDDLYYYQDKARKALVADKP